MNIGDRMKKVGYIILGVVGLWLVVFGLNFMMHKQNQKPILTWKTVQYQDDDNHIVEYYSLGYKVIIKEQGWIKSSTMKPLWEKTRPDVKFFVVDETEEPCESGKTYFYEDNYYKYYFNCNRKIKIQMNKKEYTLNEALQQKLITIEELQEKLSFAKENKVQFTMEVTFDKECDTLQGDSSKLVKVKDHLYYYCVNSANIYVNRNYSSFQEAFQNTIQTDMITIDMHPERQYEGGGMMYANHDYRMLVCQNKDVVLGPTTMEFLDMFCK